ncbi:MAG: Translation initiation factor IF-2 [Chlamydiia bacterium]|nr:Translation initiation factor IF-2 [Chlamydiia bacterium]MCH9615167.1 Translation initiation factor IF-2 [Chlamydiia bacterium]MCH9628511.1 Translation initiation factor IF-2 [Chlamydiia bacterium]
MAKNLKIKVKNAQFAEALKLKAPKKKKEPAPKKAAKATPPPEKEEKVLPKAKIVRRKADVDKIENPPPPEEVKVVETAPVVEEKPKEETPVAPPSPVAEAPKAEKKATAPKVTPKKPVPPVKPKADVKPKPGAPPPVKKPLPPKKPDQKPTRKFETYRPFDSRDRQGLRDNEDNRPWRKRRHFKQKSRREQPIQRPTSLKIRLPITVKDLAQEMKLKSSQIISKLFMQGMALTINDYLEDETTAQLIGQEFGCQITIDTTEEERLRITDKSIAEEIANVDPSVLQDRPPVITFMGHVDHGKTSLIDAIRKSNIAMGEAGAITQHIGAFKCHTDHGEVTILDTPGHEAFTLMRERGASITDIVILVIAGDEGIKPQTDEAIRMALDAKVPMVVAINKSDKEGFNAEEVYRQLAERELLPEAWGGQILTTNCSATNGEGISTLIETALLQAEILELRSDPTARARGSVVESELHKGLGAVATVLVQNGTLKYGDAIVLDEIYGRVKTMHDEFDKPIKEAGPGTPVKVTGLSEVPEAGCEFIGVVSEKEARKIADERASGQKRAHLKKKRDGIEMLMARKSELEAKKVLNLILRADVQGSVEALNSSLLGIKSAKVELNIISCEVGEISESDVELAAASNAAIVGFHTKVESHADGLIKQKKIKILNHNVIYHAVDEVKELMVETLDKVRHETEIGTAEVRMIFKSSHLGNIAGCMVTSGLIKKEYHAKLYRDDELIWEGPFASLKRVKEEVKEVKNDTECGILLRGFDKFQEGDLIKGFEVTYVTPEL